MTHISIDEAIGNVEHHEGTPSLDDLYSLTGAKTVEAITLERDGDVAVLWCDEEYQFRDEQNVNARADWLVRRFAPGTRIGGKGIGGNVVLTGPASDEDGETMDLSESWQAFLTGAEFPQAASLETA